MPDKEQKKGELGKDDLEVEPLSDEALDTVAGGGASSNGCCSCSGCSKEDL